VRHHDARLHVAGRPRRGAALLLLLDQLQLQRQLALQLFHVLRPLLRGAEPRVDDEAVATATLRVSVGKQAGASPPLLPAAHTQGRARAAGRASRNLLSCRSCPFSARSWVTILIASAMMDVLSVFTTLPGSSTFDSSWKLRARQEGARARREHAPAK